MRERENPHESSADPAVDRIRTSLLKGTREGFGDRYHELVLAQYSLYVELTDRISARRQTANSYFLAVNSLLVALSGFLAARMLGDFWTRDALAALLPSAGLVLCVVWFFLIRSYRQLNGGKFKVVHQIEALLPLAPYDAEWEALERGEDPRVYWPFSHVETGVPFVFGALYLAALALTLLDIFTVG